MAHSDAAKLSAHFILGLFLELNQSCLECWWHPYCCKAFHTHRLTAEVRKEFRTYITFSSCVLLASTLSFQQQEYSRRVMFRLFSIELVLWVCSWFKLTTEDGCSGIPQKNNGVCFGYHTQVCPPYIRIGCCLLNSTSCCFNDPQCLSVFAFLLAKGNYSTLF